VLVKSEAGGTCLLRLPFKQWTISGIDKNKVKVKEGVMMIPMTKGQECRIRNKE